MTIATCQAHGWGMTEYIVLVLVIIDIYFGLFWMKPMGGTHWPRIKSMNPQKEDA